MNTLCDVPGIRVGHAQDFDARTGCTVILPHDGAVCGVDIRGSSPGTREIELLKPVRNVQEIHAVLLTGGSAFGLNAAGGVQAFLEEQGIGYDVGCCKVPLVPAAVIFDLFVGSHRIRPDETMGYQACENASEKEAREGNVGVGCGATVGKIRGRKDCSRGGIGMCSETLSGGIVVGVLAVVNSFGDVIDPNTGRTVSGNANADKHQKDPVAFLKTHPENPFQIPGTNTTLAVVATNASLCKETAIKVSQMAQVGISRTTRPAHTMFDGDIVFALSVGERQADVNVLGAVSADLVAKAVIRGVRAANQ